MKLTPLRSCAAVQVVHRDLKLSNVLLARPPPPPPPDQPRRRAPPSASAGIEEKCRQTVPFEFLPPHAPAYACAPAMSPLPTPSSSSSFASSSAMTVKVRLWPASKCHPSLYRPSHPTVYLNRQGARCPTPRDDESSLYSPCISTS